MNIPPKYEDVVEKLDAALAREEKLRKELESALAYEDSMREELGMVRKAVPNSTLELVSLQQRLTVAERERDAALAREAEVGRLYDSLVKRSNRERDASYKREDALREELEVANNACSILNDLTKTISTERHALQQRLVVAEQLMQEFCDRVDRGEVRSKTSYAKFKAALKPAAEGEGS